jgi:hypothetical protein
MVLPPATTKGFERALLLAADILDPPYDPYWDHPGLWVQEFVDFPEGEHLTDYQVEVLEAIPVHIKVSCRGPHGLGKTTLAALAILWFALTRERAGKDWKVATTASAWRQLEKFLWPEVHKWARRIRWDKLGWRGPFNERTELQTLNLKLRFGAAFALASDTPSSIEGVHADQILYIYDEAKAIDADIYDASEGAFSGAGRDTGKVAYAMANSTPGPASGRFYDIHANRAGYRDWWVRHVRLEEAIEAGRISEDWVAQRKVQWGERSSVYQNRVEGEFATEDEDAVIPLAWIELATDRWTEEPPEGDPFTCVGVDVARTGMDATVLATRHNWHIGALSRHTREDTMETTGRVVQTLRSQVGEGLNGYAVVDVIGIGAGVVDRLRELEYHVLPFNAGSGTDMTDVSGTVGFINKRSAAWWNLRELLNPINGVPLALPPDDYLIGDLAAPKWKMTSSGKVQVESKDDIRKRIGRSTDSGDAVVQAFWPADADVRETYTITYEDEVHISDY